MEIPETLAESKPLKSSISCNLQDIGKFHDISSCNFQDILSDGNDTSVEIFSDPKNEKNDEVGPTGQNGEARGENCGGGALPVQKRSRKPTQRYIDELTDPILRYTKKRRGEVSTSSSSVKDKFVGVKDHKKCRMGSKAIGLPAEESSVVAIQVPFGSLVHKECPKSIAYDMEPGTSNKQACSSDRGNPTINSKDNRVTPDNQKRKDECTPAPHLKKRDHSATSSSPKKRDDIFSTPHFKKKRDDRHTAPSSKKRYDECVVAASPKKRDDSPKTIRQKKRDDDPTEESSDEISGRRKHHRLWTIAEVKKLIDGVSEYGVGRWSRIKKLSFSASAHRTSVDLKDKWRNLLKASRMQYPNFLTQGENKRNLAWRPLPKSILRRVCELANMHPYPKGRKQQHNNNNNNNKSAHIRHDSPDRSTDITLSDYRRILRSINGN
ncbi:telomere repeat-binding protein 5 [Phtheirospermum japonicum]|uniref:Telomere repeat-binding protein 5 n=1 Tax=Phtheirospermum japonicum TaxID=374723 RepID=A0A830B696_9LAMI|nr:telomere repeat-binding protein 5 [Phtheirospermum japonicum]